MKDRYEERLSKYCYYICVGLWVGVFFLYFLLKLLGIELTQLWPYPCLMLTVFGVYCPGCGGTRAMESLLQGDLWQSLVYHPLVFYVAVLTMYYMISHMLKLVTKGKCKAMQFRPAYLFIMLVILLVQWIGKNVLKMVFFIEIC